jgi:hypothetical protein
VEPTMKKKDKTYEDMMKASNKFVGPSRLTRVWKLSPEDKEELIKEATKNTQEEDNVDIHK